MAVLVRSWMVRIDAGYLTLVRQVLMRGIGLQDPPHLKSGTAPECNHFQFLVRPAPIIPCDCMPKSHTHCLLTGRRRSVRRSNSFRCVAASHDAHVAPTTRLFRLATSGVVQSKTSSSCISRQKMGRSAQPRHLIADRHGKLDFGRDLFLRC